jgi:hypothetical protein
MKNSVVYSSDPANLDICQGNAGHLEWQGTVESSGAWVWVLSETTNSVVTTHSEGVEMSGDWDWELNEITNVGIEVRVGCVGMSGAWWSGLSLSKCGLFKNEPKGMDNSVIEDSWHGERTFLGKRFLKWTPL